MSFELYDQEGKVILETSVKQDALDRLLLLPNAAFVMEHYTVTKIVATKEGLNAESLKEKSPPAF